MARGCLVLSHPGSFIPLDRLSKPKTGSKALDRLFKLETLAQALTYVHRLHLIATQPPDDLVQLQAEAIKVRELLYKDAAVAVARGWIVEKALDDLKGANGYKNTATDIQILIGALQASWSTIQGRVGTTATSYGCIMRSTSVCAQSAGMF